MRTATMAGPASLTNNNQSRRECQSQSKENTPTSQREPNAKDDKPHPSVGITEIEFAQHLRESILWLSKNVENLAKEAQKLKEFNLEIHPLGSDGVFRAWITEDAKVTFTVDDGRIVVLGNEAIESIANLNQENHALRVIVRTILEDPCNKKAVIAATEISGHGYMRHAWILCQKAAIIAKRRGIAKKTDNPYCAARKMLRHLEIRLGHV